MELEKIESRRVGDYYYKVRHPSGLDIYLYPKEIGRSTRAVFAVRYGSVDNCFQGEGEAAPTEMPLGIAHYLEHKLFESGEGDAFARFAQAGANANAYTGAESTSYVFSCTDRLYESLEILLDFVQAPYFTEETVAKERGIIAQEIKMYDDSPNWRVVLNYLQAMYHAHPVRQDEAGTVESIAQITPAHLYRCYNTFYNLRNMALVLAGHFQKDKVLELCSQKLKPAGPFQVRRVLPPEPDTVATPLVEQRLPTDMPCFQFGYKDKGGPRSEEDLAAVTVLLDVLASDASPLFRELLDKGLVNEASFGYQYFEGRGYATPIFGGESRDPQGAAKVIAREIARVKAQGLEPEAFELAKRSLYGEAIGAMNHPGGVAGSLADFVLRGQEPFRYIDALAELTLEQVEAKLDIFREDRSVLSVVRPL